MKRLLFIIPLLALTVYAAATRTLRFETWTTDGTNQDLTITPTGSGVVDISTDTALVLPNGTTGERPTGQSGMFRFNSTLTQFEGYDGSAWGEIGGGSGGGLDVFHTDDFEGASVSFTCGTNLTAADETTDNISGDTSKSFTQGATPPTVGVECVSPSITLDKKQVETLVGVSFVAISDHSDDEIDFVVYDEDDEEMVRIPIKASTASKTYEGFFETLSTSTSLRYELEVQTQNADAVVIIDDVEFKTNPLAKTEIFASSKTVDFNPANLDNDGTTSRASGRWARQGDHAIIQGSWTYTGAGSAAGVSFDVSANLPFDIDTSKITNSSNYNALSGGVWYDDAGGLGGSIGVIVTSIGDIKFIKRDSNLLRGTDLGNNDRLSFWAKVPIAGWSDTKNGVVVKGKISGDISSANTFSAIIDSDGTVLSESLDFINGNCSDDGVGLTSCSLVSGLSTNALACTCTSVNSDSFCNGRGFTPVSGTIYLRTKNAAGTDVDAPMNVVCQKQGTDYVKESDRVVVFEGGLYSERVEGNQSVQVTTASADTFVDMTGASISLSRGSWEVCYSTPVFHDYVSSTASFHACQIVVRDSSNNIITGSQTLSVVNLTGTSDETLLNHGTCATVTPASTTTYKLSLKSGFDDTVAQCETTTASTNFTGTITDPDLSSKIWATRVQ